jgi:hypothetical protein
MTGRQVVTSVDGRRQCDCAQKKLADEAVTKQLAEMGVSPDVLVAVLAECVPCQRNLLLAGQPGEEEVCSALPVGAAGVPLPGLEVVEGKACPAVSAKRHSIRSADRSSAAPWLSDVQIAGVGLIAVSVALLPKLREKCDEDEQSAEGSFADHVDWLFGRLNLEQLTV